MCELLLLGLRLVGGLHLRLGRAQVRLRRLLLAPRRHLPHLKTRFSSVQITLVALLCSTTITTTPERVKAVYQAEEGGLDVLQPLVHGHAGRRGFLLRLGRRRLLLPRAAAVSLHLLFLRGFVLLLPISLAKLVKMVRTVLRKDAHGRSLDVAKQKGRAV